MPSDSRDTGQIEQDCDMWIGLYRHGVYDDTCKHKGLTEGIVRLNRHGQTGTFYMDLKDGYFVPLSNADGEYMKSENDDGKKDGNKGAFNQ
jgi:replicative DNA helicase